MKIQYKLASLLALGCLLGFAGCKQENEAITSTAVIESADDNGHDHADGAEHDHSVAGHAHRAGPHDGTIADWGGGKFHVEFTVDHEKQQATVYILGADEKTPTPIDASEIDISIVDPMMQFTLLAAPEESDPPGKASRFVGEHEKLAVVQEYAGTISGVVDGTPYSGDFAEEAHGDPDH